MSCAALSRLSVVTLAGILFVAADGRASDPPKEAKAPPSAAVATSPAVGKSAKHSAPEPRKLRTVDQALGDMGDYVFKEMPLSDIAESIAQRSKINVLLDTRALDDAGVTPDSKITFQVQGISLRSALRLMLGRLDLSYVQHGDRVLLITTSDIAKAHTVVRHYDVRDFAVPAAGLSAKMTPEIASSGAPAAFQQPAVSLLKPPAPLRAVLTTPHSQWSAIEDLIVSTIAPSSWDINGGAGSLDFVNGTMIVSQTDEIQEQIKTFLTGLELVRGQDAKSLQLTGATWYDYSPTVGQIKHALNSPTEMDFIDTPLKNIVDSLQTRHGIPIQLDYKALSDAGVTEDTTFTIKIFDVPLHDALDILLAQKDLGYLIDHDVLLITTADVAKAKTSVAMYCVSDLIPYGTPEQQTAAYDKLVSVITDTVGPSSWDVNGGAGSIMPFPTCKVLVVAQTDGIQQGIEELLEPLHVAARTNPPLASPDEPFVRIYSIANRGQPAGADSQRQNQLVEMIRKLIEPQSWASSDTYITLIDGALVVRQTAAVHRQIQNLLDGIHTAAETAGGATSGPKAASQSGPLNSVQIAGSSPTK